MEKTALWVTSIITSVAFVLAIGFGTTAWQCYVRVETAQEKISSLERSLARANEKAMSDEDDKLKLIQSMDNWRSLAVEYREMLEKQAK